MLVPLKAIDDWKTTFLSFPFRGCISDFDVKSQSSCIPENERLGLEPKNHPIEKENHLNRPPPFLSSNRVCRFHTSWCLLELGSNKNPSKGSH